MKKFLIAGFVLVAAFLGAQQDASAFYVHARAWVTPNQVQAEVCNSTYHYYRPLFCRVQVVGYTNSGFPIHAWGSMSLLPGACQYAHVFVNQYGAYFVNGNAQADCVWN